MSDATPHIGLEGPWQFALGESPPDVFPHVIQLPGSLQAQGLGNPVTLETGWTGQIVDRSWFTDASFAAYREPDNIKIPFWMQPVTHYTGSAWYRREVDIPPEWAGKRIILRLERPHISSSASMAGIETPRQTSLAAPHVHDFGTSVSPGRQHLTLCIDNRMPVDVGPNSHSVTDHTQTNWNGVIGDVSLAATSAVWLDDIQVFPDFNKRVVCLRVSIGNASGRPGSGILTADNQSQEVAWDATGRRAEIELPIPPDAGLWDEFNPNLRELNISLVGGEADDVRKITYGLREVGVEGTHITVNGRKIFLRGTIECAVFPCTGYPPTTTAPWERMLGVIRDHGFNHIRFHSWCPPEAAFQVADKFGMYLQVECSSWANTTTGLGLGEPIDDWLYDEAKAIIKAFGNHPSFLLMAYGNEPGGRFREYLADWVDYWKTHEPRRLHTSGAGWPSLPGNDFHNVPDPRLQLWGEGARSRLNALPPSTDFDHGLHVAQSDKPLVAHEVGQWCAYPDFSRIHEYNGFLQPRNLEIYRDSLRQNQMGHLAGGFLQASGKLQVICYREEIEAALRTSGLAGYQLLQANDFPGQGTALVGWLDFNWNSKGYVTAEAFRRFNAPTVILARMPKRVFCTADTFRAKLETAHFGDAPIVHAVVEWEFTDDAGETLSSGEFDCATIPIGHGNTIGCVEARLGDWACPAKYRLTTRLRGHPVENDWEFWLFPAAHNLEADYTATPRVRIMCKPSHVREALDDTKPLLIIADEMASPVPEIVTGFTTIFWNTSWTSRQSPHTLGLSVDPSHPVFAGFPTEFHSNWQWWELLKDARALALDDLPETLQPLVRVIDDWSRNRRLALLFECLVNKTPVMICGMDIVGSLPWRHAARQFRKSLLDYMDSDRFTPEISITTEQLFALFSADSHS